MPPRTALSLVRFALSDHLAMAVQPRDARNVACRDGDAMEPRALRQQLDAIKTDRPAVKLRNKNLVFVEPSLVAEIEYRAWTADKQLRHASYKGLRDGADHAEVYEIG